jgi:hypothetical protein
MTDLTTYLNRGNADLIYLVELNACLLADGSLLPLYFSSRPFYAADKQFLPCISSLSDLDRAGNDTMEPAYLPTWGDINFFITGAYKPDAENVIPWNLLLYKDTYTFVGQSLTIKIGVAGDNYADFTIIFTGQIGEVSWTDTELTFTIYDKAQELETKYPDYELPESDQVEEDSWDQSVPIVLGEVKNYTPVLIKTDSITEGGVTYTDKYALACHTIASLTNVYFDQIVASTPSQYLFTKTDVSPPHKDTIGGGTVLISAFGPYTGSLLQAKWIIQIDSITALNSAGNSGSEVGLSTFRWKIEGDADWQEEGILTWLLEYDSTTLAKSPAAGAAVMAVSGTYTGDCKLSYKVKVVRAGDIEDATPPRIIWSDDGGMTWQPNDEGSWTPIASAPGVMSVVAFNPYDVVRVEITTGGNVGGAVRFKWSNDGGTTWTTGVTIPDTSPITLFSGYQIQFTAPGEVGVDDYDIGDAGGTALAVDVLSVDPPTIPCSSESIAFNRGLSAAFSGTGVYTPNFSWTPVAVAPGVCSFVSYEQPDIHSPGLNVQIEITTAGNADGTARFKWTNDGGSTWTSNVVIVDDQPLEIFDGFFVQFTNPNIPGVDDYDLGDTGLLTWDYTPAFVVDDIWTFTFKEIPIPLADGVSIQFITQAEQDFYLYDEFSFILMSTILVKFSDTTDLTIDAKGLINPSTDLFADTIGQIIYSLIRVFVEWEDADFDLLSFDAFDIAIPYTIGLVIDSLESITSIIDTLLTGIPTLYSITIAGKFYIQELVLPSGIPVLSITNEQIMDLPEFNQLPDITKRVYLEYDKNYTTNTSKDLSGVSQERLAWLKRGNRSISRKDDSILVNYPMASDLGPLETVLNLRADAGALADKLLALYQVPHETVNVQIGLQSVQLDIGDVVMITRDTFGQDAGQLYMVQGVSINFTDKQSTVTLWR